MKQFFISLLGIIILIFSSFELAFADVKRIAVLPFNIPDNDKRLEQFGRGTMETLIYSLSNIEGITIVELLNKALEYNKLTLSCSLGNNETCNWLKENNIH